MKTALSFLLLALAATPAAAQITGADYAPARLKSQATVSSDIVRIGDLVENAGARRQHADLPRTRSRPDRRGAGARRARRGAAARTIAGLDARGLSEIAVTHASRTISAETIEQRIVTALTSRYSIGRLENLKINFDQRRAADRALAHIGGGAHARAHVIREIRRALRCDVRASGPARAVALHRHGRRDRRSRHRDTPARARRSDQAERHRDRAPAEERILLRAARACGGHRRTGRAHAACAPAKACARPT